MLTLSVLAWQVITNGERKEKLSFKLSFTYLVSEGDGEVDVVPPRVGLRQGLG